MEGKVINMYDKLKNSLSKEEIIQYSEFSIFKSRLSFIVNSKKVNLFELFDCMYSIKKVMNNSSSKVSYLISSDLKSIFSNHKFLKDYYDKFLNKKD